MWKSVKLVLPFVAFPQQMRLFLPSVYITEASVCVQLFISTYQHLFVETRSTQNAPRFKKQSVGYFPFVFSFCAHENVILCFTSWAFINHSSALCFVTDNITETSWQREDERTERQRKRVFFSFVATISFVLESENWTSEHLRLLWRVNRLVLWLGRNDLRKEEAKQTHTKKRHRKKPTSSD